MPVKHEIIYPFFAECYEYAQGDSFWINVFDDLAYGKPPYGTYISKDFLICSYKGKEFSYKIERKDPEILYNEVYSLLTEKLGILSQKEKASKKIAFSEIEKSMKNSRQNWSSIRKKNIKDSLYEKYVLEMKSKYNLSIRQAKYLLSLIIILLMFKTITSKDITYSDERIVNISGIEFEEGKILLKRPICSLIHEIDDVVEEKDMSHFWKKYIANLQQNED